MFVIVILTYPFYIVTPVSNLFLDPASTNDDKEGCVIYYGQEIVK